MTLAEFVAKYSGKFVTAPGGLGGQCVDLANQYGQEVYGFPHEWKNAIDWFGFDTAHWAWVKNDAGNASQFPEPGDVVVWGPDAKIGTGPLGHIDIFLSGDGFQFHGFDQNWPVGSPAHVQWHNYEGVIGWAKPVVPVPPAPSPAPVPLPVPPIPVPTPPPAPAPAPAPPPVPISAPSPEPTPDPPIPPGQPGAPQEVPPVQNPPTPQPAPPPVDVPPISVSPPDVPEPTPVAEAGITTSEWKALVYFAIQGAGLGTAALIKDIAASVFHVTLNIPQSTELFIGGLEVAGAFAVGAYALSRGIRKFRTQG